MLARVHAANDSETLDAFRCSRCGARALGLRPMHCVMCGRTNSFASAGVEVAQHRAPWRWASDVPPEQVERLQLDGLPGVQHVTGGLVVGSVALLEGARGSGKSTLGAVLASASTSRGHAAVYACLEIREETIRRYLDEQGRECSRVAFTSEGEISDIAHVVRATRARLCVVDSYKFLAIHGRRATTRSDAERQVSLALPALAAELQCAFVAIVHMRSGDPRKPSCGSAPLQHCDAIFRLSDGVLSCDEKNRYGPPEHRARFTRDDAGRMDGGAPC